METEHVIARTDSMAVRDVNTGTRDGDFNSLNPEKSGWNRQVSEDPCRL